MMEAPKMRTYILERTRDFFTGRPDEPYSGGCTLRARRLGGFSSLIRYLNNGNALPRLLGG
jgi:hypothetical protein